MCYLEELFSLYDEMYFDGQISKLKDFYQLSFDWLPVSIRSTGRFAIHGRKASIQVSERCKGSEKLLRDTMVHEMVHAKQRLMCRLTGLESYLDHHRVQGSQLWQNKGHGHYFLTWANELNLKYPELDIQVKDDFSSNADFTLEQNAYVAAINFRNGATRFFMSDQPILNLEQLYYQAKEVFGQTSVLGVTTYLSKSSVIGVMGKLTSNSLIPTNVKRGANFKDQVDRFINHTTTKKLSEFKIETNYKEGIPKEFQDTVLDPKFTLISYAGFSDFIYYIVTHHEHWDASSVDCGIDILEGKHSDIIPAEYINFAYDFWKSCPTHSIVKHLHNRANQKYMNSFIQSNDVHAIARFFVGIMTHSGRVRMPVSKVCEHMAGIHLKPSNKHNHSKIKSLFGAASEIAEQHFESLESIVKINPDWITMGEQEFKDHVCAQAYNSGYELNAPDTIKCLKLQDAIEISDLLKSTKVSQLVNAILEELCKYLGAKSKTAKTQYYRNTIRKIRDSAKLFGEYTTAKEMEKLLWEKSLESVGNQAPPSSRELILEKLKQEIKL